MNKYGVTIEHMTNGHNIFMVEGGGEEEERKF